MCGGLVGRGIEFDKVSPPACQPASGQREEASTWEGGRQTAKEGEQGVGVGAGVRITSIGAKGLEK